MLLISNFIPLFEKIKEIVSVFLYLLKPGFCPEISVLEKVECIAQKNVYSASVG
jgi:hypothetical protein